MNHKNRRISRSPVAFVIAFATSIGMFTLLFNYYVWFHDSINPASEAKVIQKFLEAQLTYSVIFGVMAIIPSVIFYSIALKVAKWIGTRSMLYYILSAGIAALCIMLLFVGPDFSSQYFWGGEDNPQVNVPNFDLLCAYSFISGAVAGFIYWVVAI